jgi:hypothetical protein
VREHPVRIVDEVDLVQNEGGGGLGLAKLLEHKVLRIEDTRQGDGGIDDEHDEISLVHGMPWGGEEGPIKVLPALGHPRGVEEDDLGEALGPDPEDAVARRMGPGGDDGDGLADDSVDEGGLARVSLPQDGNLDDAGPLGLVNLLLPSFW